jgi:hypothetical protein
MIERIIFVFIGLGIILLQYFIGRDLYIDYKINNGWGENKNNSHMIIIRGVGLLLIALGLIYLGVFGYPGYYVYGEMSWE